MKPTVCIGILVTLFLITPERAFAYCSGDSDGAASASITILSQTLVGITASGAIVHTPNSHPTCFGALRVRVFLIGTSCGTGFKSQTHLPDGSGTSVSEDAVCSITCGVYNYAGGEIDWNGVDNERFPESAGARTMCDCEPTGGPPQEGCLWSYFLCDWDDCCPLVFDTSGRGYRLTSADRGVYFDINADGSQDAIAWTDPSRDVAFLAYDRNGNGTVDDGEELFGNSTPLPPGSPSSRANHGFDALASLENESYGSSVDDGIIDEHDAAYHRLLLWKDSNHDGISQPSEIRSASNAGLRAIETRYRETKRRDQHGNEFRLRGISWWQRGGQLDARLFYDVWFVPRR